MDDRKIYYSFNEMPFNSQQSQYDVQSSKIRFSQTEIIQILISMGALTIAFAFAFSPDPPLANLDSVLHNIPFSFLAITTAFFCHEMAHKYMGQKYGYWSEYRMYPQGLVLALFLAIFIGFVFAAPGAVQIFGNPDREKMGKISIAGPATNITLGIVFLGFSYITIGLISTISYFIAYINIILALFNLLPFGPLDGLKIFYWRKDIWVISIIIAIALLFFVLPILN